MDKLFKNTYLNITIFFLINLVFSFVIERKFIENQNAIMFIDFLVCFLLLALFSFHHPNKLQKQLFKEMLLIGISGAVFIAIFNYCYYEFMYPEEINRLLIEAEKEIAVSGFSEKDANSAMKLTESLTNSLAIATLSLLGYLFSSILGAFLCSKLFSK
jgi:hypothetical protein